MNKGLEALMRINEKVDVPRNYDFEKDYDLIAKELKGLEIIKQKGIAFLVPNSDYSNEHIHIELYANTLSEEELKMVKEILDL